MRGAAGGGGHGGGVRSVEDAGLRCLRVGAVGGVTGERGEHGGRSWRLGLRVRHVARVCHQPRGATVAAVTVVGREGTVGWWIGLAGHERAGTTAVRWRIGRVGRRARLVGAGGVVEGELRLLLRASRLVVGARDLGRIVGCHHARGIVRRGERGGLASHENGVDPWAELGQGAAAPHRLVWAGDEREDAAGGRREQAGGVGGDLSGRGDRLPTAAERLGPDGDAAVGRAVPGIGGGAGGGGREEGGVGGGRELLHDGAVVLRVCRALQGGGGNTYTRLTFEQTHLSLILGNTTPDNLQP